MANVSKQDLRQILMKAPQGTTPQGIIESLQKRGHTIEGIESTTPTPQPAQSEVIQKPNFFAQEISGGAPRQTEGGVKGFAKDVFQSTVGSRGLLGAAQLPGVVAGQPLALKTQTQNAQSAEGLADATTKLIQQRRQETDPTRVQNLTRAIQGNLRTMQELGASTEELGRFVRTPQEAVATMANAALTVASGTGKAAQKGILGLTEKFAPQQVEGISKILSAGRGAIPRAAEQAGIAAGFTASNNLEEGKPLTEGVFLSALIGGVIPVVGTGMSAGKAKLSNIDVRLINSIIKPRLTDLSYGKNPGRAVAQEGITAGSLEQLSQKIRERKQEIGKQIEQVLKPETRKYLNLTDSFRALDEAIAKAKKFSNTNKTLIVRLDGFKKDLTTAFGDVSGVSAQTANQIKREIGELAKWTGNPSDDEVINKTIQKMYSRVRDQVSEAVPGIKTLNERYSDLLAAEKATGYRIKINERQNMVSLPDIQLGGTGAIVGALSGLFTGGATALTALGAVGGVALSRALKSPRVVTQAAKWLSKTKPAEREAIYKQVPALKEAIERVFGY